MYVYDRTEKKKNTHTHEFFWKYFHTYYISLHYFITHFISLLLFALPNIFHESNANISPATPYPPTVHRSLSTSAHAFCSTVFICFFHVFVLSVCLGLSVSVCLSVCIKVGSFCVYLCLAFYFYLSICLPVAFSNDSFSIPLINTFPCRCIMFIM